MILISKNMRNRKTSPIIHEAFLQMFIKQFGRPLKQYEHDKLIHHLRTNGVEGLQELVDHLKKNN
jgi:hypothetical protein